MLPLFSPYPNYESMTDVAEGPQVTVIGRKLTGTSSIDSNS